MRQFDKNQNWISEVKFETQCSSEPKAGIVTGLTLHQYICTVYIKAWPSADVR